MAKSLKPLPAAIHIDKILQKHGLKKTLLRRNMLSAFSAAKKPLTQAELISKLSTRYDGAIDRVSIYRNLLNLRDAGVLHEVDSNHYVFCSHECDGHAHLLLFCQRCHKHEEVKDHHRISAFMSALVELRFFGRKQPIFLRGVCKSCTLIPI